MSESLPTPDGSISILSGAYSFTSFVIASLKSPTSEQQIQPALSSVIWTPASLRKPPSTPISPNSFSTRTTFCPLNASAKSFFIRVVFPAPKKPEIISIFVISFFKLPFSLHLKRTATTYIILIFPLVFKSFSKFFAIYLINHNKKVIFYLFSLIKNTEVNFFLTSVFL